MAVNPYTLNNLYSQGIIDYVPYDVTSANTGFNVYPMQNAYLSSAMQGNLYRNYANMQDSFYRVSPLMNPSQPLGSNSYSDLNIYGDQNPVVDNTLVPNVWGGFENVGDKSNLRTLKVPSLMKGCISAGIVISTLALLCKGKKVPKQTVNETKRNFFSRLFHRK